MAEFPVKWFRSDMRGAPQKSGNGVGSIIAILQACLVDGFGQVTASDITVADGVATVTVEPGAAFAAQSVIEVTGATPGALNGQHRVASSDDDMTFTFATTAESGSASGTINVKYAPIGGWEKSFHVGDVAVFRSVDMDAFGNCFRFDEESTARCARVRGYGSMSDVDNGTDPFPTGAQVADGMYLWRGSADTASVTPWILIGDARLFYIATIPNTSSTLSNNPNCGLLAYGDPIAFVDIGDTGCSLISGHGEAHTGSVSAGAFWIGYSTFYNAAVSAGTPNGYMSKSASGLINSVRAAIVSPINPYGQNAISGDMSSSYAIGALPDMNENIILVDTYACGGSSTPRARMPGVYMLPHALARDVLDSFTIYSISRDNRDRIMWALPVSSSGPNATNANGRFLIDISGPWR